MIWWYQSQDWKALFIFRHFGHCFYWSTCTHKSKYDKACEVQA